MQRGLVGDAGPWGATLVRFLFGLPFALIIFAVVALAMAPAGAVRAVGVIEAPIAAAAGRRLFKEKLTVRQMLGGAATAAGVVMTALG